METESRMVVTGGGVCVGMGSAGVEGGGRRMWSSCFSLEDGKVQEMESSDSGMTV